MGERLGEASTMVFGFEKRREQMKKQRRKREDFVGKNIIKYYYSFTIL